MEESDDVFNGLTLKLMNDEPRIENALKNFLSVLIGKASVPSPSIPSSSMISTKQTIAILSKTYLTCGRLFLKHLQDFQLIDPVSWGIKHTQQGSQSALERIDEITKYKVVFVLHKMVKEKNSKISQYFGKLFFQWSQIWEEFQFSLEELNKTTKVVTDEELSSFLNLFGDSIKSTKSSMTNDGKGLYNNDLYMSITM